MWKRYLFVALTALVLVVPTGFAAPAAADDHTIDGASGSGTGEWRITHDIRVYENGTARVAVSVNESAEGVQLLKRGVTDLNVVSGQEAVTEESRKLVWDTAESQQLVYTVTLGEGPRYGSAVLNDAVIFRTSEILSLSYWRDANPPERHLRIRGPDGWNVAAPGTKVAPETYEIEPVVTDKSPLREMIAVGDFEVSSWAAGDETVRYAAFPSAAAPPRDELRRVLTASPPVLESLTGMDPAHPMLVMTVPKAIENGGVARDHSFIVQGDSPPYNVTNGHSTYVHEFTHLYQQNWGWDGSDWVSEGMATYYQHLVLREAGLVSPAEFRQMVRVDTTSGWGSVGDPVEASAGASVYKKGEAVFAALDVAVRAETNGSKTIADVVARFNNQTEDSERRFYVTRSEFLGAIRNTTGSSYETFYENYVLSGRYPDVLLSDSYSLSDPPAVDVELPPKSVLITQNERLQRRLDEQNQTINALRGRLGQQNRTIDALRSRLGQQNRTIASLRSRLENVTETTPTPSNSATVTEPTPATPSETATTTTEGTDGSTGRSLGPLVAGLAVVFGVGLGLGRYSRQS
jgi:flagellin-like hook-associated protein FlgL